MDESNSDGETELTAISMLALTSYHAAMQLGFMFSASAFFLFFGGKLLLLRPPLVLPVKGDSHFLSFDLKKIKIKGVR